MSASDKSRSTQPALPSSSDTGPTSTDGEMLLPTPTSNQPGGTAEQHLARKARMPDGANRTSVTDLRMAVERMLPTPISGDAKTARNRTSGRKGGSRHHDGVTLSDAMALLPTPRSNADRASRASLTRQGHWSAPSLEQAVEFAEGKLPREYESWDEVQGRTSSAADFPASPSAPQDDGEARMTTDTSGPSSKGSSLKFDPDTFWSKMSLVCFLQDGEWVIEQGSLFGTTPLATFSETYPRWGSMHDGQVFAHPTPERVTNESGSSSSLGTPTAQTGGDSPDHGHELLGPQIQRQMLHTPTTGDTAPTYDHRASPGYTRAIPVPNLAAQVDDLLPTPDTTHGRKSTRTAPLLPGAVDELLPTPKTPTGGSEKRASRKERGAGGEDLEARSIGDRTERPSEGGNE